MAQVVLFTRDLRVHDHPALSAAVSSGDRVVPLFVLDPRLLGRSPNRDRFLLESLVDLDRSLQQRGGRLVLRRGDPVAQTLDLAAETPVDAVHVVADVTAFAAGREGALRTALAAHGIALHVHGGHFVVEPGDVAPVGKDVYSIFTPYHRAWARVPIRTPLAPPSRVMLPDGLDIGERAAPSAVVADAIDLPRGGETAARRHLGRYLASDAGRYLEVRNDLGADLTSRLSPYLRFGCLSAIELASRAAGVGGGATELVRQLAWRDFYAQLLASDPSLRWRDVRSPARDVPPAPPDASSLLHRWAEGRTGIPLVDAAMRQLRREGWIHNRARMVTASFLTRRLGLPWQDGAEVFMRFLVDGDPASNSGGWQWAAGTGTDPRRSRSFNPVRQAQRFDPAATYIHRYVHELRDVRAPLVFMPWTMPAVLRETGYPEPVLELPVAASRPGPSDVMPARSGQAALPV
ncbi:MAG: cryptochrome/photolyase family protein [Planctomycetaceae bacterium]